MTIPQAMGGVLGVPQRDEVDWVCCEVISGYRMEHFKLSIVQEAFVITVLLGKVLQLVCILG